MNTTGNNKEYFDIFRRNLGIFTEAEQLVLENSTVLIAGTGGIRGPAAGALVRMGIGKLILAAVRKRPERKRPG